MKDLYYYIALFCAFIIFVIIHKIGHNKKPVKRAIISLLTGLSVLFIINITGIYTGVTLPYSMLTIATSMIGGIPGVTTLLTLNLFF